MPSVLFVCTANRFRSPLAAEMLRHSLEKMGIAEDWHIGSAGTWATPGQPVLPGVSDAARGFGIDLSSHRSARVNRQLLAEHDLILVMQASQKEALLSEFPELGERVYLFSEVVERRSYDIPDSPGSGQGAREIGAELNALIQRGLNYICVLATYLHNTRDRSELYDG
jgi:protein-tyrosine-phosphatase